MTDPQPPQPEPNIDTRPARYGLILFAVYVLLYGGFMFLAVFRTSDLGEPVLAGVNLAVVYGLGLIAAAFVLAIVYVFLCRRVTPPSGPNGGGEG